MMSAQLAKVLQDIWSSKTRSLLIILSIITGLSAVGTVLNARAQLSSSIAQAYQAVDYAGAMLVTAQPFERRFLRAFDGLEGVRGVDGRAVLNVRAISPGGQRQNITIFLAADYESMRVNRITSVSGEWPPQKHHILIETNALGMLGARMGDTVIIELPSGEARPLQVAGLVSDIAQPPAMLVGAIYGYVDQETMQWLGRPAGLQQILLTFESSVEGQAAQQVLDRVTDKTERAGFTVMSSQLVAESPIDSMIQILMYILTGIGGLSLFLSIFLIINTTTAMVAQQTRQIGVMKAVGGRVRQILWMYLGVALFYGLVALSVSIPLSIVGGRLLSQYMTGMFNFQVTGSPVQAASIVLQVVIAIFGPTLASLLPLTNGLRLSATQALSGEGTTAAHAGRSLIDRLLSGANLWFVRRLPARPVVLALRNMFRHKSRLALTMTTLILAGAVFISIFNLRVTIFASLAEMTQMQTYDLTVSFYQPYRADHLQRAFAAFPEVQAAEPALSAAARRIRPDGTHSAPITVDGVRLDSPVVSAPRVLEGRWLQPGDGRALVISSSLMKNEPDLAVGQEIVLEIEDRRVPFVIVGKALAMGLEGDAVYANAAYLSGQVSRPTETFSVMVKLFPGVSPDAAFIAALDQRLAGQGLRVAGVKTTGETRTSLQSNFTSVLMILIMMALLLALVGGMGLMGAMSINVLERTREIGVLRAIGASHRGVHLVFMLEGVAIGLASSLLSIPLSYPITQFVASAIGSLAASAPWTGSFTATGTLAWLALVTLLSLAANYLPARSAARLTVREVLSYE